MVKAIVLVHTETGKEDETLKELRKVEGILEVFQVLGPYDIILKIEAENQKKLAEIVTNRIRRIDSVHSTATSIIVEN